MVTFLTDNRWQGVAYKLIFMLRVLHVTVWDMNSHPTIKIWNKSFTNNFIRTRLLLLYKGMTHEALPLYTWRYMLIKKKKKMSKKLHLVMFPFFAFGHISPFVQLSNKLSSFSNVKISFLATAANWNHAQYHHYHTNYPSLFTTCPWTSSRCGVYLRQLPSGCWTSQSCIRPHATPNQDLTNRP